MENQGKPISENAFVEFFKGLDENYQRYCIEEIKRKIKKPPDEWETEEVYNDNGELIAVYRRPIVNGQAGVWSEVSP
ncbi:hypothetical protein [Enterococcus diestrammenae]|uniref:hypothetical protein n=1 Tax=Enterococcus diestrammenae TaxID=1155073 RepID=UPI0022E7F36F|nr:hypothetical protein [Enterococcus diestrammenae]